MTSLRSATKPAFADSQTTPQRSYVREMVRETRDGGVVAAGRSGAVLTASLLLAGVGRNRPAVADVLQHTLGGVAGHAVHRE